MGFPSGYRSIGTGRGSGVVSGGRGGIVLTRMKIMMWRMEVILRNDLWDHGRRHRKRLEVVGGPSPV